MLPAAAWPQGDPVGPEFRVNTFTTNTQASPAVSFDAQGNFVVVWGSVSQDYASTSGVFGQRFASSGSPIGPEFRINTYTVGSQGGIVRAVASDPSGNFVVVWADNVQEESGAGVFGQRFSSSGTPVGAEFRVNTSTTGDQGRPAVAADSAGNFVVVWTSDLPDFSYLDIYAQRYASTGAPIGPEFRVNTATAQSQTNPRIGIDPTGNFVVVWHSEVADGSGDGISGQRFGGSGAPLGAQFRINTFTTDSQSSPDVAMDASGNFVVVWTSRGPDGNGFGISGQRFAASGALVGPEFRVNTQTANNQVFPTVAADGSGNFVVTWQSFAGTQYDIHAQRYDATGIPLGTEFRVNTGFLFDQDDNAVAADNAGNFIVVWSGPGGGNVNVFGQRYNQILPVELMHLSIE